MGEIKGIKKVGVVSVTRIHSIHLCVYISPQLSPSLSDSNSRRAKTLLSFPLIVYSEPKAIDATLYEHTQLLTREISAADC